MIWIALAAAQDLPDFDAEPIDADRFHPAMDGSFLLVQDAQPLTGRGVQFRALYTHAANPYVWVDRVTGETSDVLTASDTTVIGGSLWGTRARVGFDVPVHLSSTGPYGAGLALGDARVEGRWSLLDGGPDRFGAVLTGGLGIPLGPAEGLLSPPGSWGEVGFATDYRAGRVLTAVEFGLQFGPRSLLDPDLTWDDQAVFGIATGMALNERVDVSAELVGATQLDDVFGLGQGSPIEAVVATDIDLARGVSLRLGGGAGLTDGVGAPDWRAVAGLSYRPEEQQIDSDGDGLDDGVDRCIDAPEDLDGFRDEDGCPDLDDDGDLIVDTEDVCPREAEDIDGYEDGDGCPEGNATLLLRVVDWGGRPLRADIRLAGVEVSTSSAEYEVELEAGRVELEIEAPGHSPWFDSIEVPDDGVVELDAQLKAFGARGYVEVHGLGSDGEPERELRVLIDEDLREVLVLDGLPQLELSPGPHELTVSAPGRFPERVAIEVVEDEQQTLELRLHVQVVELDGDQLRLTQPIEFRSGTDEILAGSLPIVDQVASTLLDHPEIKLLRVEGHTDATGPDKMNLRLSQERADAVARALRDRGIAPGRVYAVGFGEDFPIADNETPEGKAQNRRVNFFIEERD